MSALVPRGLRVDRAGEVVPASRHVSVRWIISRAAAARVLGPRVRSPDDDAVLEVSAWEGPRARVRAVLRWGTGEREIRFGTAREGSSRRPRVTIIDDGDLTHWEVTVGGRCVLAATIGALGASYARTCLLSTLRVAGGRYEVARDLDSGLVPSDQAAFTAIHEPRSPRRAGRGAVRP